MNLNALLQTKTLKYVFYQDLNTIDCNCKLLMLHYIEYQDSNFLLVEFRSLRQLVYIMVHNVTQNRLKSLVSMYQSAFDIKTYNETNIEIIIALDSDVSKWCVTINYFFLMNKQ